MSDISFTLPNPGIMYTTHPSNGAATEGRLNRKGCSSMKISAYTRDWKLDNVRWFKYQPPEMSVEVEAVSYTVELRSFLPIAVMPGIKRYDSLGFWKLSYNEILRHLQLATHFKSSPIWKPIVDVYHSVMDEIWDAILEFYDGILEHGDFTPEHWAYYVKDHGGSSSPFARLSWSDIAESPTALRNSHLTTSTWLRDYVKYLHGHKPTLEKKLINAKYCYPGIRARPGDYKVLSSSDFWVKVYVEKYRDRKVGGIDGLSQSTFPIYHKESKRKILSSFYDKISKAVGIEFEAFELTGPQMFLDLKDWHCYDLKTAEKQTGLLLDNLGFSADLSAPGFSSDDAGEMYSGIGPTGPLNVIYACILLKAMGESEDAQNKLVKFKGFSDNIALAEDIEGNVHMEKADTFCGWNVKDQRFGDPSYCTDNVKHRLSFQNRQEQHQWTQYLMRPFLTTIMNGVLRPAAPSEFIAYISREFGKEQYWLDEDGPRHDVIKDFLQGPDNEKFDEKVARHSKILSAFPEDAKLTNTWFKVQSNNPYKQSDLRVEDT